MQLASLLVASMSVVTVLIILFFFNYPTIVHKRVVDQMVFRNNTEAMGRFESTKDIKDLRLTMYLYSVTNADEVIRSSAKIKLAEIGPFVYDEFKYKEFLINNQTSGLITYKLRTRYTFNRQLSMADPKTVNITWPNVPLLVARAYLDKLSYFKKQAAYFALNMAIKNRNEPAFITDSAANLLFDGSKRKLFEYLQSLDVFKVISPWPLKDNKFGMFYGRNNTWDPAINHKETVSTGFGLNRNYTSLNEYIYVDNSDKMPFWQAQPPQCNMVGGTDGEFFHPFLDYSDLTVYSEAVCRKFSLRYSQNAYIGGITSYRYNIDPRNLKSGRKVPENACYCLARNPSGAQKPECELDGLIDLSTCAQPNIVASGAHFMHGSTELLSRLDGVTPPDASKHDISVFVEPNTGVTIKVRVPLQFNVRLEKGGFTLFDFFQDDESLIVPLVWVAETSEITDDQASMIKKGLLLLDSWFVSLVLGGAIVLFMAVVVMISILCVKFRDASSTDATETAPILAAGSQSSLIPQTGNVNRAATEDAQSNTSLAKNSVPNYDSITTPSRLTPSNGDKSE